jgi:hypothetical protein
MANSESTRRIAADILIAAIDKGVITPGGETDERARKLGDAFKIILQAVRSGPQKQE